MDTVYTERKGLTPLELIFLSEKGKWITHLTWLAGIILLAIKDNNPMPIFGFVLWAGVIILIVLGYSAWYWWTTTEAEREAEIRNSWSRSNSDNASEPLTWGFWLLFPASPLIVMTLALFLIIGPSDSFITQRSMINVSVTKAMAFHIPIWENVETWNINHTVSAEPVVVTKDGKKVKAKVSVVLATDNNEAAILALSRRLDNPTAYQQKLQEAVEKQLALAIGKYDLATLPSNLVLEDLVGTRIGLDGMYTTWSGTVKITEIHRFAD